MAEYNPSNIKMTFHDTTPKVEAGSSCFWIDLTANHLQATIFLSREQAQTLAADLIAVAGPLPEPKAVIEPAALSDAPTPEEAPRG